MGRGHRGHGGGGKESEDYNHCHHGYEQGHIDSSTEPTNYYSYYPKLCARHRVPSVCNSEGMGHYQMSRQSIRGSHSRNSSGSQIAVKDKTSTIDRHELKNTSSRFYRRKRRNTAAKNFTTSTRASFNSKRYGDERQDSFENECSAMSSLQHNFSNFIPESTPQISNKVYFHLGDVDETTVADDDDDVLMNTPAASSLETEQQLINFIKTANLTDNEKLSAPKCNMSVLSSASSATLAAVASSSLLSAMSHDAKSSGFMFSNRSNSSSSSSDESQSQANMTMDETIDSCVSSLKADTTCGEDEMDDDSLSKSNATALGGLNSDDKTQLSWDSYWDGLESVVLGHTNNASIK